MQSHIPHHSFIERNNVTLKIVELGSGPPVLFCHGFPDGWRTWRRQMDCIASAGYRAISFDMRGYGDSSAPANVNDYTLFKIAGDLVGICAALGIQDVTLVGHDFGAAAAWVAAMIREDLFKAVFGISVPPMMVDGHNFLADMEAAGQPDFYMFRQMAASAEAEWANASTTIPGVLYWTSGLAPANERWNPLDPQRGLTRPSPIGIPAFADKEDTKALIQSFSRNSFHGALNYYRALPAYIDQAGAFLGATISQPSCLVVGEVDGMTKLREVSESDLRKMLVNLKSLVTLKGVGHWPHLEASADLNQRLLRFLSGLS